LEAGYAHGWGREPNGDEALASYADPTPTPEETIAARASGAEIWQLIGSLLRNERERVLVYLMYEIGLSSGQIQAKRPDLFLSIKDVYTTTRNLHERLGRSAELRAWLARERE